MKKVFITYGDARYDLSRERIMKEAKETGFFHVLKGYRPEMLTQEVLCSPLMKHERGGGLWLWKPDIILQELNQLEEGDILVYADCGCTLRKSNQWNEYAYLLMKYDIIAQRIFQPTYKWTRKEIIEKFSDNPENWTKACQCCATVIMIKCTAFTKQIISQWRNFMLNNPSMIEDVRAEEMNLQHKGFIENRHDQSVWSALIYKYLHTKKIKIIWEQIEGHHYIYTQAIEATRLKNNKTLHYDIIYHFKNIIKQVGKFFIYSLK